MPESVDQFIARHTQGFNRMGNQHFASGYGEGFLVAYCEKKHTGQTKLNPMDLRLEIDGPVTRADEEWNDGYKVGFLNGGRDSVPADLAEIVHDEACFTPNGPGACSICKGEKPTP